MDVPQCVKRVQILLSGHKTNILDQVNTFLPPTLKFCIPNIICFEVNHQPLVDNCSNFVPNVNQAVECRFVLTTRKRIIEWRRLVSKSANKLTKKFLYCERVFYFLYYFLFCRWKQGEDGKILQKEGKNILEFLAIKSLHGFEWAIPEVLYDSSCYLTF